MHCAGYICNCMHCKGYCHASPSAAATSDHDVRSILGNSHAIVHVADIACARLLPLPVPLLAEDFVASIMTGTGDVCNNAMLSVSNAIKRNESGKRVDGRLQSVFSRVDPCTVILEV